MSRKSAFIRYFAAAALAAPLPLPAHAADPIGGPAVSAINGKISGEGGLYDDQGAGLVQGSLTIPLGHRLGFQADGALGTLDDETLGGGAAHLFARDPSRYLFGVYASYHTWDSIDIWRLGAETELYFGRMTLSGILGWESIDVPATKRGLTVLNRDDDHFFTELDLSYYPKDNLRLSIGYHYESEESLGVAELEFMPRWHMPASLFATGNFGDDDHTRITGGIRFYLHADRSKSLIRRHREDDPKTYTPIFPNIVTTAPAGAAPAAPNFCPVNTPLPETDTCACPPGSVFSDIKGPDFICATGAN